MRKACIVILALILFLSSAGCGKRKVKLVKRPLVPKQTTDAQLLKEADMAEAILKPKPYEFTLSRDPFKPLFGKTALLSKISDQIVQKAQAQPEIEIKLTGILIMDRKKIALLEYPASKVELYKEGDKIDEYSVASIESHKVVLKWADKDRELILKPAEEK